MPNPRPPQEVRPVIPDPPPNPNNRPPPVQGIFAGAARVIPDLRNRFEREPIAVPHNMAEFRNDIRGAITARRLRGAVGAANRLEIARNLINEMDIFRPGQRGQRGPPRREAPAAQRRRLAREARLAARLEERLNRAANQLLRLGNLHNERRPRNFKPGSRLVIATFLLYRLPTGETNPLADPLDPFAAYTANYNKSVNYTVEWVDDENDERAERVIVSFFARLNEIDNIIAEYMANFRLYPYVVRVVHVGTEIDRGGRGAGNAMRIGVLKREGLTNLAADEEGDCVIKTFAKILEGFTWSPRERVKGQPITVDLIRERSAALGHPTDGLTDMQAGALFKDLGGRYFRVFDILGQLNKDASWERETANTTSKNRKPGIILVHTDGHCYAYIETGNESSTQIQYKTPELADRVDPDSCIILDLPAWGDNTTEEEIKKVISVIDKKTVYSRTPVMGLFVRLVASGTLPVVVRCGKSGEITHFVHDGRHYLYTPDVVYVKKFVDELKKKHPHANFEFRGQSMHSLLLQALPQYRIPASHMNPQTLAIFTESGAFENYVANCWLKTDDLACIPTVGAKHHGTFYDICRSFTAAVCSFPLPVHSLEDDVKEYHGGEIVGYWWYRVINCNTWPIMYSGHFYIGHLVAEMLADNIITREQIRHVIPATSHTKPERFQALTNDVARVMEGNDKLAINSLVGLMKTTGESTSTQTIIVRDRTEVLRILDEFPGSQVYPIYHKRKTKDGGEKYNCNPMRRVPLSEWSEECEADRDYEFEAIDWENLYFAVNVVKKLHSKHENYLAHHHAIPQLNNLQLYRHTKKLTKLSGTAAIEKIVVICTDLVGIDMSIYDVDPTTFKNKGEKTAIGEIKYTDPPKIKGVYNPEEAAARNITLNLLCDVNRVPETAAADVAEDYPEGYNMMIYGGAGCGKSYMMAKIYKDYEAAGKRVCWLTPTHELGSMTLASYGIKTRTVASALGLMCCTADNNTKNIFYSCDILFIDEILTLGPGALCELLRQREAYIWTKGRAPYIIAAGDDHQLPPIGLEKCIPATSSLIRTLCGNNMVELKTVRRANNDPDRDKLLEQWAKCRGTGKIGKVFPSVHVPTAICASHTVRNKVNTYWAHKLSGGKLTRVPGVSSGLFVGILLRCRTNTPQTHNGQLFTLVELNPLIVSPLVDYHNCPRLELAAKDFEKSFVVGYCGTTHSKQGASLDNYSIYELDKGRGIWGPGFVYSAITRGRTLSGVNVCDLDEIDTYLQAHNIQPLEPYAIYLIEHKRTGKKYVGSTNDLGRRMQEHSEAQGDGSLARDIRAEGWSAFTYKKIDSLPALSRSEIFRIEMEYITQFNSLEPDGYNVYTPPNQ